MGVPLRRRSKRSYDGGRVCQSQRRRGPVAGPGGHAPLERAHGTRSVPTGAHHRTGRRLELEPAMSVPERIPTYAELPIVDDAPPKSAWGVFGRDDQLGTLNFVTPERRLAASRAVRRGAVFNLDLPLHLPRPPMIAMRTAYRRTNIRFPANRGRDDVLDNFYLQCSSQWDSLKHIRHPEYGFYNWTADERADDEEDGRLGIDNFARHG